MEITEETATSKAWISSLSERNKSEDAVSKLRECQLHFQENEWLVYPQMIPQVSSPPALPAVSMVKPMPSKTLNARKERCINPLFQAALQVQSSSQIH